MNSLQAIDWAIIFAVVAAVVGIGYYTKRYSKSAADFLSANRSAGRYLLTMGDGMATLAAVATIAMWQQYYKTGFGAGWWSQLGIPISVIMVASGWVIYRFRETRAFTMAQFFEMRYSKRFRIFAACVCLTSGVINFGVFPAIGANFFIIFGGLPEYYTIAPLHLTLPTYHTLLVLLIGISVYLTLAGGQITILITDFFQYVITNIIMLGATLFILIKFPLTDVFEGLLIAEEGFSKVNPFDAGKNEFSPWFFIVVMMSSVYNRMAWQGNQAYNSSAISPHEAKLASVLASIRVSFFPVVFMLFPYIAYMLMNHPDYTDYAATIQQALNTIENDEVRDQMIVPMTMRSYMPVGMMGAIWAVMLAALVSTHDTYLHSWGTIFVQDIIMPLRKSKKPLSPKKHILLLRLAVILVGVFIFIFSCFYKQTENIYMFFAITGAIWLGGVGAVIIGGLYTNWGKTRGAYAALITGAVIATSGMIVLGKWKSWYGEGEKFFLDGQEIFFLAMVASAIAYVVFSLLGKRNFFNLDKMLHRGKYVVVSDHENAEAATSVSSGWDWRDLFGLSKEFHLRDKFTYGWYFIYSFALFVVWIIMTTYAFIWGFSDEAWCRYFFILTCVVLAIGVCIIIWFLIGGIRDAFRLFKTLREAKIDVTDDGTVIKSQNEENNGKSL